MPGSDNNALSEREEQVLLYATRGLTDKEIARKLGISTATVLTYWMRIRNKLGGSNRAELVASAVRMEAEGEIQLKQTENTQLLSEILRRMQAEDTLRENEEKYRLLFNGGIDWILVYHLLEGNRPGKFIEVNDVACQVLGYDRDELLQMTILDITDPKLAGDPYENFKKLMKEQRMLMESVHCTKDGRPVPTEMSSTLFTFRGKPTVQSVCRDLTARREAEHALKDAYESMERRVKTRTSELEEQIEERRQMEQELAEAHALADSLISSSLDAVFAYDAETQVTVWNPVMEQLTGAKRSDVLGRAVSDVVSHESVRDQILAPLQGKTVSFEGGYLSPIIGPKGRIMGALGVLRSELLNAKKPKVELR